MYPILDTRVECKSLHSYNLPKDLSIRIEPDWNVNGEPTQSTFGLTPLE